MSNFWYFRHLAEQERKAEAQAAAKERGQLLFFEPTSCVDMWPFGLGAFTVRDLKDREE